MVHEREARERALPVSLEQIQWIVYFNHTCTTIMVAALAVYPSIPHLAETLLLIQELSTVSPNHHAAVCPWTPGLRRARGDLKKALSDWLSTV